MNGAYKKLLAGLSPLILAGCVSSAEIAKQTAPFEDGMAGFQTVSQKISAATGKRSTWAQSQEQNNQISKEIHAFVLNRTISADIAVQVALLNNKGLQAAYADIGIDAADVWQQMLPENPKVSVGIFGIAAPEAALFRTLESVIATNLQAMMTRDRRVDIANTRFLQTQLKAVDASLKLAADTRKAWIRAVAAFEAVHYLKQGQIAADAASELAEKLGESGALPKAGQAR